MWKISYCIHRNWEEGKKQQSHTSTRRHNVLDSLINSKCLHLYTSRSFGSLLVWSVQVCVNPVPSRKDTSNDLNEKEHSRQLPIFT